MNQENHSFSSLQVSKPIQVNLDEFQINEDTFKPMTKGLGFHQDLRRPAFKQTPKEKKNFSQNYAPVSQNISNSLGPKHVSTNHLPSGLEAFYGNKPSQELNKSIDSKIELTQVSVDTVKDFSSTLEAPMTSQFFAWIIDVGVIASFVALTGALLVLASGIEFSMYSRILPARDLILFSGAIFSIYYILYFTILDLGATPGKTILGIRLVTLAGKDLTVKHTLVRSLISLLSGIALFLPMLLDFQGRLSETKLVK